MQNFVHILKYFCNVNIGFSERFVENLFFSKQNATISYSFILKKTKIF